MANWKIPLFAPHISVSDVQAVTVPLIDGWLTMGEKTEEFERTFAELTGAEHAMAVCNGTAALHLALIALEVQAGDEVIVPSFTFVACANVIVALGATPVFADICDEDEWTISPDDIRRKITERTKAILVVHYAGFPCRMDEILPVAQSKGIPVIEDCAHALLSYQNGKACGTFGQIGCFSFFSNKNMTTGEGGMVITNDVRFAERIRLLRSHGMSTLTLDRHRGHAFSYDVLECGYNYRIDEIRSALGLSQIKRLKTNLEKRKQVYAQYKKSLRKVEEMTIPFQVNCMDDVGYHIFPIFLRDASRRESFMQGMKEVGIQTSIHYPPVHRFSAYRQFADSAECPVTERIAAGEVTLPFFSGMTEEEVTAVCEGVKGQFVLSSL